MASLTAAAILLVRGPRQMLKAKSSGASTGLVNQEIDLTPTLVNAREIEPILNGPSSRNGSWNPEPQWTDTMRSLPTEVLAREKPTSAGIGPIPEAFPLEPRLKKGPPVIGEAFGYSLPQVGQIQPLDTPASQAASPFSAKPVLPPAAVKFAHQPSDGTASGLPSPSSVWPDQTYASSPTRLGKPEIVGRPPEKNGALNELMTPHLLTGTIVRPHQPDPPPLTPTPANNPTPFTIKEYQPPKANYILQPMRVER